MSSFFLNYSQGVEFLLVKTIKRKGRNKLHVRHKRKKVNQKRNNLTINEHEDSKRRFHL